MGLARRGLAETLTKGAHVQIEAEISSRAYAKAAKRTLTERRVLNISKLDRPAKVGGAEAKGCRLTPASL